MSDIIDLGSAVPSDQPHLLAWDAADPIDVRSLCNKQNADYINYRDNLLDRTSSEDKFLVLDRYVDRELKEFRELCLRARSEILVLHELEVLLAYLESRPGGMINVFWDRLLRTRHLAVKLWVVMPHSCIPPRWPKPRIQVFRSTPPIGATSWTS